MSKPVLGIIGGGQLGSMLATAAKKIGIKTVIFCDDQDAPAQSFSDKFICGKYDDQNIIDEFINAIDIATFEFENIPYETLIKINNIKSVLPNPSINKILQNRLFEKDYIRKFFKLILNIWCFVWDLDNAPHFDNHLFQIPKKLFNLELNRTVQIICFIRYRCNNITN